MTPSSRNDTSLAQHPAQPGLPSCWCKGAQLAASVCGTSMGVSALSISLFPKLQCANGFLLFLLSNPSQSVLICTILMIIFFQWRVITSFSVYVTNINETHKCANL